MYFKYNIKNKLTLILIQLIINYQLTHCYNTHFFVEYHQSLDFFFHKIYN